MKTIRPNAEQVLSKNTRHSNSKAEASDIDISYSVREYAEYEAQSDPDFFRWLFDDPDISDFGSNLTDEEMSIANKFIESL